jgi:hypothetical protein
MFYVEHLGVFMSGYNFYSGLVGSKTVTLGSHADKFNFTNVNEAFAATKPGDILLVEAGTYSLTSAITVDYNLEVIGMGRVVFDGGTAGLANRLFMLNKPPTGTAITRITFRNIIFSNAYTGADCVEIDNDGGGTGAMKWKFFDCGFESTSGLALDVDQTTNTIDMYGLVKGYRSKDLYLDSCNFALSKAASEITVEGYDLYNDQAFVLGAANVASIYNFISLIYSSSALTTGGAASVIENSIGCAKVSAGAISAVLVGDFDATAASENLQAGTIAT